MSITSLFYVGLEYNVYYTRFPREVVLCKGRIDRIEKEWVEFTFTSGSFRGSQAVMHITDLFNCNYERKPLVN